MYSDFSQKHTIASLHKLKDYPRDYPRHFYLESSSINTQRKQWENIVAIRQTLTPQIKENDLTTNQKN